MWIRKSATVWLVGALVLILGAPPAGANHEGWAIGHPPKATISRDATKAVLAIVDGGINPYHWAFRDPSPLARRHPSTYIPGYPEDAVALRLTLDDSKLARNAADHTSWFYEGVIRDCERSWSKVEPGKLYWIPGTKIIGAITFEEPELESLDCNTFIPRIRGRILEEFNPQSLPGPFCTRCILPQGPGYLVEGKGGWGQGNGTRAASRAVSGDYGACKECRIVAVQFSAEKGTSSSVETPSIEEATEAISWVADNSAWIDAQSNSWRPMSPAWEPSGENEFATANPEFVRAVEESSRAHLSFWTTGDGPLLRLGGVGQPTIVSPHLTPSAIMVGGHDSGYVQTSPGLSPHIVADACGSITAMIDQVKGYSAVHPGTEHAPPFAAGMAARILLEARRILGDTSTGVADGVVARGPRGRVNSGPLADGEFTLEEWKRITFISATRRPKAQETEFDRHDGGICPGVESQPYGPTPVKWTDVPDDYPEYVHIGYGATDEEALELAIAILRGDREAPDRSATDDYFAADKTLREGMYEVWSKP